MFTQHERDDGLVVQASLLSQLRLKTSCIQTRSGSENMAFRKSQAKGNFSRHNITRVADINKPSIETGFSQSVHPSVNGVDGELSFEASVHRTNEKVDLSGCIYDNVTVRKILIGAGRYPYSLWQKRNGVENILSFAFCLLLVNIGNNQFIANTVCGHGKHYVGTNMSGTYYSNFSSHFSHPL